jgi:hypothetical protein
VIFVLLAFHIDDDFSAPMRGEDESILQYAPAAEIVFSSASGKRTALAATTISSRCLSRSA